jgi:hypothetical protein
MHGSGDARVNTIRFLAVSTLKPKGNGFVLLYMDTRRRAYLLFLKGFNNVPRYRVLNLTPDLTKATAYANILFRNYPSHDLPFCSALFSIYRK